MELDAFSAAPGGPADAATGGRGAHLLAAAFLAACLSLCCVLCSAFSLTCQGATYGFPLLLPLPLLVPPRRASLFLVLPDRLAKFPSNVSTWS